MHEKKEPVTSQRNKNQCHSYLWNFRNSLRIESTWNKIDRKKAEKTNRTKAPEVQWSIGEIPSLESTVPWGRQDHDNQVKNCIQPYRIHWVPSSWPCRAGESSVYCPQTDALTTAAWKPVALQFTEGYSVMWALKDKSSLWEDTKSKRTSAC